MRCNAAYAFHSCREIWIEMWLISNGLILIACHWYHRSRCLSDDFASWKGQRTRWPFGKLHVVLRHLFVCNAQGQQSLLGCLVYCCQFSMIAVLYEHYFSNKTRALWRCTLFLAVIAFIREKLESPVLTLLISIVLQSYGSRFDRKLFPHAW